MLRAIPATLMRGGTSKGLYFAAADLPADRATRDAVLLAEVYAAGEAPIVGADGRALARALRLAGQDDLLFVPTLDDMTQTVLRNARDGDVVMCMGAGSIGQVPTLIKRGGQP